MIFIVGAWPELCLSFDSVAMSLPIDVTSRIWDN